jgi:hypothetical protein
MHRNVSATRTQRPCLMALVAMVAFAAQAAPAAAQSAPVPPAQCNAKPKHEEKFRAGFATGRQKADAIFAAADIAKDRKKLRRALGRVLGRLHGHVLDVIASERSDARRCRVQGVAEGFISRLAELLGECVLDGAHWAQFAANLYCELSIEVGGLADSGEFYRAPAGLCGTLFERVCDAAYGHIATEAAVALEPRVQSFLAERSVTLVPYRGCAEYTRSPFDRVFESAVLLDCSYEPP